MYVSAKSRLEEFSGGFRRDEPEKIVPGGAGAVEPQLCIAEINLTGTFFETISEHVITMRRSTS